MYNLRRDRHDRQRHDQRQHRLGTGAAVSYQPRGYRRIDNVTISGNSASSEGGGLDTYDGVATVENCHFTGNAAGIGGGVAIEEAPRAAGSERRQVHL